MSAEPHAELRSSVIVLSMGDRGRQLQDLADSFDVPESAELILVDNGGAQVVPPGPDWRLIRSDENLGVPGGRNLGAAHAHGEVLIFLDDDARSCRRDLIDAIEHRFASEPMLGIIGLRIVKHGSDQSQQRWSPFLGRGGTTATRDATTFVGGGHAIRRDLFERLGGYYAPLFYGLEETDLAWRALDAGMRVSFDSELILSHPDVGQDRHPEVLSRTARNRVWIARRRLPIPLMVIYCAVWLVVQLARCRGLEHVRETLGGTWNGVRNPVDGRSPMSWSTALEMTRLGRPPII